MVGKRPADETRTSRRTALRSLGASGVAAIALPGVAAAGHEDCSDIHLNPNINGFGFEVHIEHCDIPGAKGYIDVPGRTRVDFDLNPSNPRSHGSIPHYPAPGARTNYDIEADFNSNEIDIWIEVCYWGACQPYETTVDADL